MVILVIVVMIASSTSMLIMKTSVTIMMKEMSIDQRMLMQGKRKKSETAVRKSDMEYYAACIKTERSRLDWEGAVKRGVKVVFIINIVIIFTNTISIIIFIISMCLSSSSLTYQYWEGAVKRGVKVVFHITDQ